MIWDNLFIAIKYVLNFAPLWLPIVFVTSLFKAWINFRHEQYWQKLGSVLLEIKIPKEIYKSPLAMELILNQLHQTADEGNWYWRYWRGQTRSWFSLEIISIGGDVHFYIWARKKYRNGIESHMYSQYPGIEIHEVEDYTKDFVFDKEKDEMFACQWQLSDPDPLPISTYVDYGLDKDPKEEYKIDPMSSQLEFLGSLTKGHNIWIQIIVRAHKAEQKKSGTWFGKTDRWRDEAQEQINAIIKKTQPIEGEIQRRGLTKGETERIAAIERSVGKIPFDVSIRSLYFAPKDIYDSIYLGGLLGSFKQYAALGYNGFKSAGWHSKFSNPVIDWIKTDKGTLSEMILEEYKLRRYFFSPHMGKWFYSKPFVLNSEELATIFHLPSSIVSTPTLERVSSRKVEAPSNLPI